MAIALYSTTNGSTNTSFTADTGSGANRYACAMMDAGTNSSPSTVTVGSDSLTQIFTIQADSGRRRAEVWAGVLTVTGNQTTAFTGSLTDGMGGWGLDVFSGVFTGAHGTQTASATSGTSATVSLSATVGDWMVGAFDSDAGALTAGSFTTFRFASGSSQAQFDSNGVSTPTSANISWSGSHKWGIGAFLISPPSTANGNFLNFM